MTGDSIKKIRVALGMEPTQFAQLLGIHPSTLYRWESVGMAAVRVEPLQLQLLTVLEQQVAQRAEPARADLGKAILTGLLVGGGLLGLFFLLDAAYSDNPQVGASRRRRNAPRKRGGGSS